MIISCGRKKHLVMEFALSDARLLFNYCIPRLSPRFICPSFFTFVISSVSMYIYQLFFPTSNDERRFVVDSTSSRMFVFYGNWLGTLASPFFTLFIESPFLKSTWWQKEDYTMSNETRSRLIVANPIGDSLNGFRATCTSVKARTYAHQMRPSIGLSGRVRHRDTL